MAKKPVQPAVMEAEQVVKTPAPSKKAQAILVRLSPKHPQESYGRCGLRFNKSQAVDVRALSKEALERIHRDPWLVVEGSA